MREGTRSALLEEGRLDEGIIKRAAAAAVRAAPADRVGTGLEALIAFAERDPAAAREALLRLRVDHATLRMIERHLPGTADRATLGLGAAIQVALAELESPLPDLRGRMPELLRWLRGEW